MKTFSVEIRETRSETRFVTVQAETEEQAWEIAREDHEFNEAGRNGYDDTLEIEIIDVIEE